jgi:hypothetical protein
VLGYFPARWAHHRSWAIKLPALLALMAGIVAIIVVNAFVAHYRDAYERLGDEVVLRDVIARLIAAPADLMRLQSWLLFLLGVGFAGLGFAKGYSLDDPYPGYGAVDRRRAEAETAYISNRQMRIEEVTDTRDRAITSLASAIERLRGAAAQREQILGARAQMVSSVASHEVHLEQAANALVSIYRDANRAVRTEPTPAHFSTRFRFQSQILESTAIKTLLTTQIARHDAEALIAELDRLRNGVLTAYAAIIDTAPAEV